MAFLFLESLFSFYRFWCFCIMQIKKIMTFKLMKFKAVYRGIYADIIVYIFSHLHMALLAGGNMVDIN